MSLVDLLVCPICHGTLDLSGRPRCTNCSTSYARRGSFLDMTPNPPPHEDVASRWQLWEQLQANGAKSYATAPALNLAVGDRPDATEFGQFCDLRGKVLDIGCGPQAFPSYGGRGAADILVGIDPLVGDTEREFEFVGGIGEYLPFRDGTFDRVLFGTSLDHVLSPVRALHEARRVLTPTGFVCIWYGEGHEHGPATNARRAATAVRLIKSAARLVRSGDIMALARRIGLRLGLLPDPQAYIKDMTIPTGAVDHFHFQHLTGTMVKDWLQEAELKPETITHGPAGWFVRAVPS